MIKFIITKEKFITHNEYAEDTIINGWATDLNGHHFRFYITLYQDVPYELKVGYGTQLPTEIQQDGVLKNDNFTQLVNWMKNYFYSFEEIAKHGCLLDH